jgi:hypothetical protein
MVVSFSCRYGSRRYELDNTLFMSSLFAPQPTFHDVCGQIC